jgi:hypothetical protein
MAGLSAVNMTINCSPLEIIRINCTNSKICLVIIFSDYIESEGQGIPFATIEYQIDNNNMVTDQWAAAMVSQIAIKVKPIPLIKQLMNSRTLLVRTRKMSSTEILEASCDLDGLAEAIVAIQRTCNWR